MKIIPAIDIIDGKCVRLKQGDYAQKKIYNENPVEVAKQFENAGLKYLHVVDLDGAKEGKLVNTRTIEALLTKTTLTLDVGGGIKTAEDIQLLLSLGAAQVNLGSIAVKKPEQVQEWIQYFGVEKIILSADVRDEKIAINGWQEQSSLTLIDFIEQFKPHNIFVTCTDIATDGMLAGTNLNLYSRTKNRFPSIRLIASGGVNNTNDIEELEKIGAEGVIIGKAIYEDKIQLKDLAKYVN